MSCPGRLQAPQGEGGPDKLVSAPPPSRALAGRVCTGGGGLLPWVKLFLEAE